MTVVITVLQKYSTKQSLIIEYGTVLESKMNIVKAASALAVQAVLMVLL